MPSPEILKKFSDPLMIPYTELMEVAGYIDKPPNDLERIDNMIQFVQNKLLSRYEQRETLNREFGKFVWDDDTVNDPTEYKLMTAIRNTNDKYINAFENSLNKFSELRAIIENGQPIENLTTIISSLINPKIEDDEPTHINGIKINYDNKIELSLNDFHEKVGELIELSEKPDEYIDKDLLLKKVEDLHKLNNEIQELFKIDRIKNEVRKEEFNDIFFDSNKQLELKEILKSDTPIEVNGKPLTNDEREKLLKIAETMFSD